MELAADRPRRCPTSPSIAVLPFTNISGDPEQEYFADGLVEDIITSLSRVRSFFVIARNSSFTYKGRAVDVRQVARELGVRYVLEGSIRKAGTRVRDRRPADRRDQRAPCLGRPLRRRRHRHLRPAGQGDRERGGLRSSPASGWQEIRQARAKPTSYITAYDLYLRALPRFYSMTREGFADVRRLTNEALAIDPELQPRQGARAPTSAASPSASAGTSRTTCASRCAWRARCYAEARDDPTCLRFAAQVLAYSAKDYETALSAIERSLQLNPNSAQGYTGGGWVNAHAGRPLVAIEHFHRAMRLSPLDPGEGHRALRHRHELPDARALRGCPDAGASRRCDEMPELRLLAPGGDLRPWSGWGGWRRPERRRGRLMEAFPTYTLSLQRRDQSVARPRPSPSAIWRRCASPACRTDRRPGRSLGCSLITWERRVGSRPASCHARLWDRP